MLTATLHPDFADETSAQAYSRRQASASRPAFTYETLSQLSLSVMRDRITSSDDPADQTEQAEISPDPIPQTASVGNDGPRRIPGLSIGINA